MQEIGLEMIVIDDAITLKEQSTPATPFADKVKLYAKDNGSGVSTLAYKNDAGTEFVLPSTGSFVTTAGGTANRMTYWTGSTTIAALSALTSGRVPFADSNGLLTDASNLAWDNSTKKLTVTGSGTGTVIQISATNSIVTFAEPGSSAASMTLGTSGQTNGYILTPESCIIIIDSDNDQTTRVFQVRKDAVNAGSGSLLLEVSENGGARLGTSSAAPGADGVFNAHTGFRVANAATSGNVLRGDGTNFISAQLAHADLSGLTSGDPHTQYAFLAGRSGGQSLIGGTAASNTLTLQSTSNATRGDVILDGGDLTFTSTMRARMSGQNRFRHLNSIAVVTHDADQTISNGTVTALAFNTELTDTDGLHDNSTNNTRLTIPLAGKWLVGCIAGFDPSAGGSYRQILLKLNGTTFITNFTEAPAGASSTTGLQTERVRAFSVNDYIEVFVVQDSGGDLKVSVGSEYCPIFYAAYLGE